MNKITKLPQANATPIPAPMILVTFAMRVSPSWAFITKRQSPEQEVGALTRCYQVRHPRIS